jgi:glycosyltransferase involved in cell wall biosynthesis
MKILLITLSMIEKVGGEYYTHESWFNFPIKLAQGKDPITLLAPVRVGDGPAATHPKDQWKLDFSRIRIEHFDPCSSYVSYYKKWPFRALAWSRQTQSLIREHDVVVLRCSSPNIFTVTRFAKKYGKKLVLIYPGNIETSSTRVLINSGIKRLMAQGLIQLITLQDKYCSQFAKLIYIQSEEVLSRFGKENPKVKFMQTPHISLSDFPLREDTCQADEIRLLRVGWLSPVKGLEYLFQAVQKLVIKGLPVRLLVLGKEPSPNGYGSRLKEIVAELGIGGQVEFKGWVPFDQVKRFYQSSDIQIISSLSEGVPRCLIEGAASGLPLVSTPAGGCKKLLTHERNALIVPMKNSQAIADAVEKFITDGVMRRRLIQGGFEVARKSSFEHLGMKFLNDIRNLTNIN